MKRIFAGLAVLAAVSLTSSVASAASACSSLTLPANVMTTVLMTATGCDAGGLNFSNFNVSSVPGGMSVSLAGVTVSTGEVDLAFQIGGFSFILPSNPTPDLRLVYEVKGPSTGVNNLFGGSSGTTILETVCDSKGVSGGACVGTQLGQLLNGSPNSNPSITFASQTDIWIIKDIGVSAGFDGRVIVSDFTNGQVTSGVPEPMTLSMMGAGLLGLSIISRRRKKS